MIPIVLFCIAIVFTCIHEFIKHRETSLIEIFLSYLLFFNIGMMGLIAFIGHVFKPNEIAELIGWPPGSPFQSEVGAANLAFGVLGILSIYFRGLFWLAAVIGSSVFLLIDFMIHVTQYRQGDVAPYNIGSFVWFNDLAIPFLCIVLLIAYFRGRQLMSF